MSGEIEALKQALSEARREYEGPMAEEIQALKQALAEAKARIGRMWTQEDALKFAGEHEQKANAVLRQALAERTRELESWQHTCKVQLDRIDDLVRERNEAHSQLAESYAAIRALWERVQPSHTDQ